MPNMDSNREEKSPNENSNKRKNDSDEETNQSVAIKNDKKIKIPIKLAVSTNSSSSSSQSSTTSPTTATTTSIDISKNSSTKTSTAAIKNDTVKPSATAVPIAKLPTGNLAPSKKQQTVSVVKNVSEKVAKVFGSDESEEDTVEMPFEAKIRMRNLGRNTPTSQGPNSYGKTNLGFCDQRKLFEKQLKEKSEELLKCEESNSS